MKKFFEKSLQFLKEENIQDFELSVKEIFSKVLQCSKMELPQILEEKKTFQKALFEKIEKLLLRRKNHEPLAYILEEISFYGCLIAVTKDVLIPRVETEILVDRIVSCLKKEKSLKGKVFWDVCCGSGCIGIPIKKQFPELQVILSDQSIAALELAEKNAKINGVDVGFRRGDLLEPFQGEKADFFVSNPPYVSLEEYEHLEKDLFFEPKEALLGGVQGTEYYMRFAKELKNFLNNPSKIFFEMGFSQGKEIQEFFLSQGWPSGKIFFDWSGKERFFFLEVE